MMRLIRRTRLTHLKLRSALTLLVAVAGLCAPAAAEAQISVAAFPVSTTLATPVSGGTTVVEPALSPAPDGSNAEWFVVVGRNQNVLSITPAGQQRSVVRGLASDAGNSVNFASVSADGYDWVLDNDQGPGNVLYAIGAPGSSSPGLNQVARFGDYGQDMTLGPDGALYVSDNAGIFRCQISAAPSASCSVVAVPPPFYTGAGAFALGSGGNAVWFTDGSGQLGAYGPNGISGPYPAAGSAVGSTDVGTLAAASNGYIYVASGAAGGMGVNTTILAFSPGDPQAFQVAASGLGNVVAMATGPDGNIWFLDDSGPGSIGELNTSTGQVTTYPIPAGFWLPSTGWRIASGPNIPGATGTGELFFTASTAGNGSGNAAIGVVSGIPLPTVAGTLAFKTAVNVSRRHRAVLTLTCTGEANAACAGSLNLRVRARVRVRVQIRSARKGGRARFRTVLRTRKILLGSITYTATGGQSLRETIKLSRRAYRLLEASAAHTWTAAVSSTATQGSVSGTVLTMIGPAPRTRSTGKRRR